MGRAERRRKRERAETGCDDGGGPRSDAEALVRERMEELVATSAELESTPWWRHRARTALRAARDERARELFVALVHAECGRRGGSADPGARRADVERAERRYHETQERLYARRPGDHPDPDHARRFTAGG